MISAQEFGVTRDHETVMLYRIVNSSGAYIEVISYGAVLRAVRVNDGRGKPTDVCLGYETILDYEKKSSTKYGATIGRVAGRIEKARFELDGVKYKLAPNLGAHMLHGGAEGFDRKNWSSRVNGESVVFYRTSPDGEEGFPGALTTEVRYSFSDKNELTISYLAETDADTLCSLTNHSYWNLGAKLDIHLMHIFADKYVEARDDLIPTGATPSVSGSNFDFRGWTPLGDTVIDHSFPIDGEGLRPAVELRNPLNGISMEVSTTLPSLHIFTADTLPDKRAGVAFEAQYIPNGINMKEFPSPILRPAEKWEHKTVIKFS